MKYMIATTAAIVFCIILGTFAAHLLGRRRNLPPRRKALLAALFSVLLLAAGSLGYLETYYRAADTAKVSEGGSRANPRKPFERR